MTISRTENSSTMLSSMSEHIKNVIKSILNIFFRNLIIYRHSKGTRDITITFDDGPSPESTEIILKALATTNTKAIFFILGRHAQEHPDIVKKIHEDGHTLGNHGFNHSSASKCSLSEYVNGVIKTEQLIAELTSANTSKLFRPPYGDITLMSFLYLAMKGYKFVMWNYDSNDSFIDNEKELLSSLIESPPENGAICLFHDDYRRTANLLEKLINKWKSSGYIISHNV